MSSFRPLSDPLLAPFSSPIENFSSVRHVGGSGDLVVLGLSAPPAPVYFSFFRNSSLHLTTTRILIFPDWPGLGDFSDDDWVLDPPLSCPIRFLQLPPQAIGPFRAQRPPAEQRIPPPTHVRTQFSLSFSGEIVPNSFFLPPPCSFFRTNDLFCYSLSGCFPVSASVFPVFPAFHDARIGSRFEGGDKPPASSGLNDFLCTPPGFVFRLFTDFFPPPFARACSSPDFWPS